jgi:hypothetical protein
MCSLHDVHETHIRADHVSTSAHMIQLENRWVNAGEILYGHNATGGIKSCFSNFLQCVMPT